jgi:hypothetical protein
VRRIAIRLAMRLYTDMRYFMEMPIPDLMEIVEEVNEINGKSQNL